MIAIIDGSRESMPATRSSNAAAAVCCAVYASIRTQIYLTDDQRRRLDNRGRRTGAPLARMIREAVDAYLVEGEPDAQAALDATFGSLPELELPDRDEWDRGADPD
jgi:predicted DNA-binding protein